MKGGEVPCTAIGTFDAADINYASAYLAGLVVKYHLPPKMLVVHRFTKNMVTNYRNIQIRPEVQLIINMDGFGFPAKKKESCRRTRISGGANCLCPFCLKTEVGIQAASIYNPFSLPWNVERGSFPGHRRNRIAGTVCERLENGSNKWHEFLSNNCCSSQLVEFIRAVLHHHHDFLFR